MEKNEYQEPPAVNWRKRKRDREIKSSALSLWATGKLDTKDIANALMVPEAIIYNLLFGNRKAP